MSKQINILIAASEVAPLSQTGGLAEVTGSLPTALSKLGIKTTVVVPAYQSTMKNFKFTDSGINLNIQQGNEIVTGKILKGQLDSDVSVYLIDCPKYYDRAGIYTEDGKDYPDNPERFIYFCKAVLELALQLENKPDIILANDWQTGPIMAYLKARPEINIKGAFTIHNQGYLGLAPFNKKLVLDLPEEYYSSEGMEYYGQLSYLKAGIVYSDAVITVSPTYAKEIQTPEGGHGLDGVMRRFSDKLFGILNGVNYDAWDPTKDPAIASHYSAINLKGKQKCRQELIKELNLDISPVTPVIGMVTRLTAQKGLSLVYEAAEELFRLGVSLVVLGNGEAEYENLMLNLVKSYPGKAHFTLGYDRNFSHRIIAASDFILVPSLYEPCGLIQLYGLRYGAIPIVRAVGGLNDTVKDSGLNGNSSSDTGFKFTQFQSAAFLRALRRAVDAFANKTYFKKMVKNAMTEDFSWENSARLYQDVFTKLLK